MQKFPAGKFHAALQSDAAITRLLVHCTDREILIVRAMPAAAACRGWSQGRHDESGSEVANDLYPLRIAGGAWSIAVAVTVRVIARIGAKASIAGIAATALAIPVVVADISHGFGWCEVLGCGGEIAHGDRRCRHSHGAAQRGAGDKTDRESFHGIPPSIAAPSTAKSRPFPCSITGCDETWCACTLASVRENDFGVLAPTTSLLRRSTVPVRPMPSSVKARRVRIPAIPTAIVAVIASVLGLEAVRLRAGRLGQVPTGLGHHDARAAYERYS